MTNSGKSAEAAANSLRNRKIIKWMWISFASLVIVILTFFILAYNAILGYMPPVEDLNNPQDKFATTIYSSDGVEMGRYFRNTGNRVYADYNEISPYVVDALIATEDARFMSHSGIDLEALARVLVKTLVLQHKNSGGGSTITQQLAIVAAEACTIMVRTVPIRTKSRTEKYPISV